MNKKIRCYDCKTSFKSEEPKGECPKCNRIVEIDYKTSCNECIFSSGDPQEGCKINRIEKFKEHSFVVKKDNYFLLQKRCNAKRTKEWEKTHYRKIVDVYNEIFTPVDIIIDHDNPEKILKQLDKYLEKPNHIYILSKNINEDKKLANKNITVINLLGNSVLEIIHKFSGQYLLYINKEVEENYLFKINKYINHDLKDFIAINDNPLCINKSFVTIMNVNYKMSFDNIKDKLLELDEEYVIKTWEQMV